MMSGGWRHEPTAPKKRTKRAFLTVKAPVSQLGAVLLVTAGTNVEKSLGVVGVVLVVSSLQTSTSPVELHTDVVILAVRPWNPVNIGTFILLIFRIPSFAGSTIAGTVTATIPFETRECDALGCCVLLRNLLVATPNILQAFFNGLPVIRPLKLAHLPRVVDLLVSFKDPFVLIIERHVTQELEEGQLVSHRHVEPFHGNLS